MTYLYIIIITIASSHCTVFQARNLKIRDPNKPRAARERILCLSVCLSVTDWCNGNNLGLRVNETSSLLETFHFFKRNVCCTAKLYYIINYMLYSQIILLLLLLHQLVTDGRTDAHHYNGILDSTLTVSNNSIDMW